MKHKRIRASKHFNFEVPVESELISKEITYQCYPPLDFINQQTGDDFELHQIAYYQDSRHDCLFAFPSLGFIFGGPELSNVHELMVQM